MSSHGYNVCGSQIIYGWNYIRVLRNDGGVWERVLCEEEFGLSRMDLCVNEIEEGNR
jgi:hypothetical protein